MSKSPEATTRRAAATTEQPHERIGTCELCGATDHHLVAGECPGCRKKCAAVIDALFPTGYSYEPTRSCNHDGADSVSVTGNLYPFEYYQSQHPAHDGINSKTIQVVAVLDPADMPIILADEDLEYWGRWFVGNHLEKRGVNFETFMTDPFAIARALVFRAPVDASAGDEFLPLLPEQIAASVRADRCPRRRAITRPTEEHDLVFLRKQAD